LINYSRAQQVIVTDDASYTTPATGAMLDVNSTNKGFLPPRVTLTGTEDATTITSPSSGLIIYNTATAGTSPTNVTPGCYYNAGSPGAPNWIQFMKNGIVSGNGISILPDGSILLNGTATNWTDLVVNPVLAKNSGGTVPAWAVFFTPDVYTWDFEDGKDQSLDFSVQIPHGYKEGSTLYPHIHWAPKVAAGTKRVLWKLDYQWVNLGDAFAAAAGTAITGYNIVVSGSGVETTPTRSLILREAVITPIGSGISGTGKQISSILMCRLTRVGINATNDNLDAVASLLSIDFHYEIDTFGSQSEFTK
jgi:hypothetical protein